MLGRSKSSEDTVEIILVSAASKHTLVFAVQRSSGGSFHYDLNSKAPFLEAFGNTGQCIIITRKHIYNDFISSFAVAQNLLIQCKMFAIRTVITYLGCISFLINRGDVS